MTEIDQQQARAARRAAALYRHIRTGNITDLEMVYEEVESTDDWELLVTAAVGMGLAMTGEAASLGHAAAEQFVDRVLGNAAIEENKGAT